MRVAAVSDEPVIGSLHRGPRPSDRAWLLLGGAAFGLAVAGLGGPPQRGRWVWIDKAGRRYGGAGHGVECRRRSPDPALVGSGTHRPRRRVGVGSGLPG